ncbi:MAG: YegS/Rv2252/BmrU family lipid kinase [Selenomonadaceae bacterium]|nr:YegS/Rv2252/BmrU family lipid kinase [Selenomonadaceae bacterium]
MKKILLVYNPVSGHAAFKHRIDQIVDACQRRGILLSMYRTRRRDWSDFERCVVESRAEGLIAAGGDGTLHAVVNAVMKSDLEIPIGIIGSGTSNDFATHLGINDLNRYFDAVADGHTRAVDVGIVNGREYFINVASAGMLTSIAHEVNTKLKNSLGKPAYYLRAVCEIPKFRSHSIKVAADGIEFELDAFLFVVLNSPTVAGLNNAASFASIDDGKLDFIAVRRCSTKRLLTLTRDLFSGRGVLDDDVIFKLASKRFYISSDEKLISDLDGEAGDELPIEIDTLPRAVEIFVQLDAARRNG